MKKLFLVLALLLVPSLAQAALSQQTIWEVRTNGSNTNGGGFTIGVLSKSSATDLAVSAGSNVNVSSVTYGFTSADIGRWIKVTAGTGFTTGFYNITAVAGGVATLNISPAAVSTGSGSFTVYYGLDYSQQNAANSSGSNKSTTDLVTAGTTTITSATASFTQDIVGNVVYIAGGTGSITGGWYEVTAYTSATSVTVDRSTGLTAGTGATLNVGGAIQTIAQLCTNWVGSNKAFVKADGTYTTATTNTCAVSNVGSNTSLSGQITGYTSTRGDGGQATLQATASGVTLLKLTASYYRIANITADCNSQTTCNGFVATATASFYNCKAKNFTVNGFFLNQGNNTSSIINSEVTGGISGATAGISINFNSLIAYNNIHDNVSFGIQQTGFSNGGYIIGNLITNNTGASNDGMFLQYPGYIIINNTVYGSGRDGIGFGENGGFFPAIVQNNITANNGRYGLNFGSGAGNPAFPEADGNAYYSNATANRNNLNDIGTVNSLNAMAPYTNVHDVILTASPFVSAGTNNFQLNSTSGGGAAVKAVGLPASWPGNSLTSGYLDMGAVQHQCAGAGGSCVFGN